LSYQTSLAVYELGFWGKLGSALFGQDIFRHNILILIANIGKIQVPVLLIRGEEDPLIEEWEGNALRDIARKAGNENVAMKIIPGAGHDCMDNPDVMIPEIVSLFSGSK